MNSKHPKYIGIILGVLYGLSLRIFWEVEALRDVGGLVMVSLMFFLPFVIGFIRIHLECKVSPDLPIGRMIYNIMAAYFLCPIGYCSNSIGGKYMYCIGTSRVYVFL